ncbi:MAG: hypothetical protein ACRDLA_15355 [Thermoleophilaceae bacterium]
MNWRAIGCGTLAALVFVAIGLIGVWRVSAPTECPELLPYEPASYEPVGETTDGPRLEGVEQPLERAGPISFGLAAWDVWVEPGRVPAASGEPLPQRIVLECGDGSFQSYRRDIE